MENKEIKRKSYLDQEARKTIAVQTRLDKTTYKKLISYCKKNKVTISNFMRARIESTINI